jgi:hypothetical protein
MFGAKNWRLNTKKLHLANVGTFELRAQKLVKGPNAIFLHLVLCGAFELGAWKLQRG